MARPASYLHGIPLYLLICLLTAGTYALPDQLRWASLAGLAFIYVASALPRQGETEDSPELKNGARSCESP